MVVFLMVPKKNRKGDSYIEIWLWKALRIMDVFVLEQKVNNTLSNLSASNCKGGAKSNNLKVRFLSVIPNYTYVISLKSLTQI